MTTLVLTAEAGCEEFTVEAPSATEVTVPVDLPAVPTVTVELCAPDA